MPDETTSESVLLPGNVRHLPKRYSELTTMSFFRSQGGGGETEKGHINHFTPKLKKYIPPMF